MTNQFLSANYLPAGVSAKQVSVNVSCESRVKNVELSLWLNGSRLILRFKQRSDQSCSFSSSQQFFNALRDTCNSRAQLGQTGEAENLE